MAFFLFMLTSCLQEPPEENTVQGVITVDNTSIAFKAAQGTTVKSILDSADIEFSTQDKIVPELSVKIMDDNITIKITRITENFLLEEQTIPYEQQTIRNESLLEGETRLVQAGKNGLLEITYRYVYEDGVQVSKTVFKSTIIEEAIPEITMVGVKSPLLAIKLPTTLVYLTGGNAWLMQESTENRFPIITTGDLDGRVFELSPDKKWLLFTRTSTDPEDTQINSLWAASLDQEEPQLINLETSNIIHYADWHPSNPYTLGYSTVEPRETAPGWQANNDLILLTFDPEDESITKTTILDINAGGLYGWWGTTFQWSPNGELAFARPDAVGLINLEDKTQTTLIEITPYNTREDWAWTPGLSWDASGDILYFINHTNLDNLQNPEDSSSFNLAALIIDANLQIDIVQNSGMFAYPAAAPDNVTSVCSNKIAFLQAVFPEKSQSSRYRLVLMDADGSNKMTLFPEEGSPGLNPQQVKWANTTDTGKTMISFIYQGNLWIFDLMDVSPHQITSDGLTTNIDW